MEHLGGRGIVGQGAALSRLAPPTIRAYPQADEEFIVRAKRLATCARTPAELEAQLRRSYPGAVARARELDGDPEAVWYVYRDGRWRA